MKNTLFILQRVLQSVAGGTSICALLLLAISSLGCGNGNSAQLGRVEGVVTLDGQPLADADVTFQPEQEGARASVGTTDSQGRYQLTYLGQTPGAVVGTHRVQITTLKNADDDAPPSPETLPTRYHQDSETKAEVGKGKNTFDFHLESKP